MRTSALLLISLLLVGACTDSTGPSDPERLLEQNIALWNRTSPASYQYTLTRLCNCADPITQPVTIVVRNQLVETRNYLSGLPVEPQYDQLFTSVPGLFDLIRTGIITPAAGLAVRYDATMGYPVSIQIDWVAGVADDEVSYRIEDFEALPPA